MKFGKEIKVGVLTIIAGAMLYFGFQFLKGVDFVSPVKTYYLIYENVNGLTISNPVLVNGFTVGKVKDIEMLQDGDKNPIKVIIDVEDNINLGENTKAILTASSLFGGMMIELKLGNNDTIYETGARLKSSLEKSVTEELEEIAKPVIHNVDTTLTKLRNFIDAEDKASFKNIIKNMEESSRQIMLMSAENRKSTREMSNNLIYMTGSLNQTVQKFDPLLDKLDVFADSLNTLHLANTIGDIENAISNIDSIIVKINSKDGTVGMLLNDKTLINNLAKSIESLDSLTEHFEEHPGYFLAPLGKEPKKKSEHWDEWHGGYKNWKKTGN